MQASSDIKHTGIIQSIGEDITKVSISSVSACASCKAKSLCSASDMQEKIIDIEGQYKNFNVGEEVDVVIKYSQGFRALFFGYVLPFIVLFATLLITLAITNKEWLAGILALIILIPYYLILYYNQDKLKKRFSFQLSKHFSR